MSARPFCLVEGRTPSDLEAGVGSAQQVRKWELSTIACRT